MPVYFLNKKDPHNSCTFSKLLLKFAPVMRKITVKIQNVTFFIKCHIFMGTTLSWWVCEHIFPKTSFVSTIVILKEQKFNSTISESPDITFAENKISKFEYRVFHNDFLSKSI